MRDFVVLRCGQLGVPRGTALRLELLAEELFINATSHGRGAGPRLPIDITIRGTAAEVQLVIEDRFAHFDPFADLADPSRDRNPENRPVGGLGRALVAGLASHLRHESLPVGNRITITIAKPVPAARLDN